MVPNKWSQKPHCHCTTPHSININDPNAGKCSTCLKQNRVQLELPTNRADFVALVLAIIQAHQLFFECFTVTHPFVHGAFDLNLPVLWHGLANVCPIL